MKFVLLTFLVLTTNVFAMDVECRNISEYQMKMDAHASNYTNAKTTRTPEGGAYKYKKVVCNKECKIIEYKSSIQTYVPNHPDADKNGYVAFPYIDKEIEKSFISAYAKSLVMVSQICPTQVSIRKIENGQAVLMKYSSGNIVSDIINFESNGGIISWVRQTKNGESKIVNL